MTTELLASSAENALEHQHQTGFDGLLPDEAMHVGGSLVLPDGREVHVRAIRPDDSRRLCVFHSRLSPETIYLRYFAMLTTISEQEAQRLACVDYEHRMAVVATPISEGDEQIIALAGYEPAGFATAEVSFVVEDDWQGQGIGKQLLYVLATYARRHGIVTFIAQVMPFNARMLAVLHHCGYPYAQHCTDCVEVHLDISADIAALPARR